MKKLTFTLVFTLATLLGSLMAQNNPSTVLYENWVNGAWVPNQQSHYSYDSHNAPTTVVIDTTNGTTWLHYNEYLFTNNTAGFPTQLSLSYWMSGAWGNSTFRYTYTYNAANKITSLLGEYYSGAAWVNNSYATLTYDANNFLIGQVSNTWNTGTSAWVPNGRNTYTNNTLGNPLTNLSEFYSAGTWSNYSLTTNTYNAANKLDVAVQQNWNTTGTNNWENAWQFTYTYDATSHETSKTSKGWDFSNHVWFAASGLYSSTYNADHSLHQTINQTNSGSGTNLVNQQRITYSYSTTAVRDIAVNTLDVQTFPNPATDELTFVAANESREPATLSITNLQGQLVQKYITNGNRLTISVANLPAGMYVATWEQGDFLTTKKIVVAKRP